MKAKFQIGSMVGWKSDTDHTKSNKELPAQKVLGINESIDGNEYKLTKYLGWHLEHELEQRQ